MGKLVISGFADEISLDFDEQLRVVRELGMNYISLRSADGKMITDYSVDEFKDTLLARLEAAGVKISSMGSPIGKIKIDNDEDYERQLAELENLCQMCELAGCNYIRMFGFYMPDAAEGEAAPDPDAFEDAVVEKLQGFVKVAEQHKVTLIHENEKEIFGDIGRRCARLFERISSPYFKMAFDFANFVQCDEDTEACWEALREHVAYIHIKDALYTDSENVVFGTGDGKGPELLRRAIIDEGYEGFLTLEPHLVLFDTLSALETTDPTDVIKENKAKDGAEGYRMQFEALVNILLTMGLKQCGVGSYCTQ